MRTNLLVTIVMSLMMTTVYAQNSPNAPGMQSVDISELKPLSQSENVVPGSVYSDVSASAEDRAADLLSRMTFEEKLDLTGGWNRFLVCGVPRLGVRPVSMADASQGIRIQTALVKDKTTSYPGMMPLASTWNRDLAAGMAAQIAEECRSHGVDILLGPGINMQRLSVGGRAYEYFGEDPFLTAEMSSSYIVSLQGNGIIACPKHFIANDQDFCRHITDFSMDERTLREIYLLPWEMAVKKAGTLSMMTGNNHVNGYHAFMNRELHTEIMRNEFGFKGFVMTDWQNTSYFPDLQHLVLEAGTNLMMPENTTFKNAVLKMVEESPEDKARIEKQLDRMVGQILYPLFKMGIYDRPFNDPSLQDRLESHKTLARQCAVEAAVLLKNEDGILPLEKEGRILYMGLEESSSGTGSGFVTGYDHVSIADGLKAVYGDNLVVDRSADDATVKNADVVIFSINKPAGEGFDVPFDEPRDQIERLRQVVALNENVIVLVNACNSMPMDWADNAKAVVWSYFLGQERGSAIADLFSGKENFSGKLPVTLEKDFAQSPDPDFNYIGGKPYWKGNNQYKAYWTGAKPNAKVEGFSDYIKPHDVLVRNYDEGVFMGYRWADKTGMPCYWHFGDGLSYTEYDYKKISVKNTLESKGYVTVTVSVKNIGEMAGKETVQLYVHPATSKVERPYKELKGFEKVEILPGKTAKVTFRLDARAFQYWDAESDQWTLDTGRYEILVGGSSSSLPLKVEISL